MLICLFNHAEPRTIVEQGEGALLTFEAVVCRRQASVDPFRVETYFGPIVPASSWL
jgi:hypothetical protein